MCGAASVRVFVSVYTTDRPFSHSGPEFTYVDTGLNLTSYTWIVLQVSFSLVSIVIINYYAFAKEVVFALICSLTGWFPSPQDCLHTCG